jgi:pyruvate,orthophosphate dikinase
MVEEGLIDKKEAILRVDPQQLDQLLHPVIVPESRKSLQKIAVGLPASPGAAVGKVVFTADDAVIEAKNSPVILVRAETVPDDIHGMEVAKGILTARGGMTSHAAVVARGMGIPCVAGAGSIVVDEHKKQITVALAAGKNLMLKEGDWLSLDGSTGEVFAGQAKTAEPDPRSGVLATFMGWADEFRGAFGVRANADIPRDAKAARAFGAEGIGLCRTEHMFFAEDKILAVRQMILANSVEERRRALEKIQPMQRADFAGIFKAMDGLPVTIRLLDPPLHEFLPAEQAQIEVVARELQQLPIAGVIDRLDGDHARGDGGRVRLQMLEELELRARRPHD